MSEVKLLPCPFCGDSEHLLVEHLPGTIIHPAYRVHCDNCGACIEYTDKDCQSAWNTRANLAERDAEVEALRAEVESERRLRIREEGLSRAWKARADFAERGLNECAGRAVKAESRAERLAEALREAQPFIGWTGSYPELHARIDALLREHEEGK